MDTSSPGKVSNDDAVLRPDTAEDPKTGANAVKEEQNLLPSKKLLTEYKLMIEQRRQDPIYLIKPISLVEETIKYDYEDLEESLINFILEKVVMMREVPFVRAIEKLERNANVNKIYDQISKTAGIGGFAGKQNSKKWQQAFANRDQY